MRSAIVYKYTPTDIFTGKQYEPEYRTYITKDSSDENRVMEVLRNSNEYKLFSKTPVPDNKDKLLRVITGIINELLKEEHCIFSLIINSTDYDDYTDRTSYTFMISEHGCCYVESMHLKLNYTFKNSILNIFNDFGFSDVVFQDNTNNRFVVTVKN